jgi:hypothetical protein
MGMLLLVGQEDNAVELLTVMRPMASNGDQSPLNAGMGVQQEEEGSRPKNGCKSKKPWKGGKLIV